jgi:hypothetical protein
MPGTEHPVCTRYLATRGLASATIEAISGPASSDLGEQRDLFA